MANTESEFFDVVGSEPSEIPVCIEAPCVYQEPPVRLIVDEEFGGWVCPCCEQRYTDDDVYFEPTSDADYDYDEGFDEYSDLDMGD